MHTARRAWTPPMNAEKELHLVSFGRTSVAPQTHTLEVGDVAPDFELPGHRNGEKFRLSESKGKKNVVIVFYPLDWTPV